jgi:hypothetical protein
LGFIVVGVYDFSNGYGASVICNEFSYGGNSGLYELAVLRDGDICYDSPIADDVVGYLTERDVRVYLDRIEKLEVA